MTCIGPSRAEILPLTAIANDISTIITRLRAGRPPDHTFSELTRHDFDIMTVADLEAGYRRVGRAGARSAC